MAAQEKSTRAMSQQNHLPPADIAAVLGQIDDFLKEGDAAKGLELIARAKSASPWMRNAAGVCHLRLGNPAVALDILRGLVLATGGFDLKPEAPTVFKANFATALLLTENLGGFQGMLSELEGEEHPALSRLREAYGRWKASMTLWQRIRFLLGAQPTRLTLDFPPGNLM